MSSAIDRTLTELGGLLIGRRRDRRRVLAEARDHLLSHADALQAEGHDRRDAEAEAIARFGPPAALATGHAREVTAVATDRLALPLVVAAGTFVLLFFVATQIATVRAGAPAQAITSGAAGVAGWIGAQLAVGCLGVTLVRLWQGRRQACASSGDAGLVVRGALAVLAVVGVNLVLELEAFHRLPAGQGQHAALVFGLAFASGIAFLWALDRFARAQCRLRGLERLVGREAPATDLATAIPLSGVAELLRRRPGRLIALLAASAGLAAGMGHLVGEGPSTHGLLLGLAALALIAAIEATIVLTSYVVLGGFLGIRGAAAGRSGGRPRAV